MRAAQAGAGLAGLAGALGFRRVAERVQAAFGAANPGRHILLTGAVLVIGLIAGATGMVLDRRAADLAAAEHETEALSVALTEQTSLTFGSVDFVLRGLLDRIRAAGIDTPEALAASTATSDVQRMLHDQVAALSQMDVAAVADADGRLLNVSRQWPVPDIHLDDRDYFRALRDDPALKLSVSGPTISRSVGLPSIYIARRIEAPDGRFLGIVLGAIRLDYLANLYRAVSEEDGRYVSLFRRDGMRLVFYPEVTRPPGTFLPANPAIMDIQRGTRISRSVGQAPLLRREVLRVARALDDFPLVLIVGRTMDSILADWRRQTWAIGIGVALAAIALFAAFNLLARQIAGRATSEAALAVALDHMSQGLMMIDADDRIQVHNQRVREMLNLPPELLAAKPRFKEILRYQWDQGEFGQDGAGVDEAQRLLILAGGLSDAQPAYERRRPDGTVLEVRSNLLPGGGRVRTYSDVTVARTREAALVAALAERDEAETALRRHRDDLEREVAERTRELAASEARHRDVAEVASDWFLEMDADHRITFVSERFFESADIPASSVIGHRFEDLLRSDTDPVAFGLIKTAIERRRSFENVVKRVVLPTRGVRYWRLSAKPFTDMTTGAFGGYRGTGTDVTETVEHEAALNAARRRAEAAEQQAQKVQARLVDAIEAIPESFVLHDADDRLVLCNTRYAEMYQLSAELIAPGARFADAQRAFVMQADPAADPRDIDAIVTARLERHRAAGGNREDKRLPNGRWMQVLERRTSDGGTVGIGIDVTEERQRAAAERDREKLAALGHLAGGVAHEINNLLQPALVLADLLRDSLPPDDADGHEALDHVLDSTRKMREIVRNILLFARKEDPRLTPIDLVAELRTAIGFVGNLVPPSIEVRENHLDEHLGAMVAVNKTQLTQVVTNLLVNAAQATTGSGTVTVSVARVCPDLKTAAELAIEAGRPYLAVSIADTGCGMDAATCARIFEPFFTTKPIGQGTGLGLSVAYGILRSWHGAISVRSEVGKGTTFVLYVPVIENPQDDANTV
jgi:signal transduction histidine kinase